MVYPVELAFNLFEAGAWAVKTPGGGFVLTRFLLLFHRMEKEEPVRLEDKRLRNLIHTDDLFPTIK